MQLPRHVHIVGICGVATSALAIAFQKKGALVSGSDKGFFPPVSTELDRQGITYYAGWHPEKMLDQGRPDLVMAGGSGASLANPEVQYAKKNGIPVCSYAETLGRYFTRNQNIICAGTWGKSSSTALLSFILEEAGLDPSYMFGGISLSHESSAKITETGWGIFEGDEYQAAIWDKKAKFFYYRPTHLLLTAVSWDHADLYPTEVEYFEAFRKLLGTIPPNGLVVACADNPGIQKVLDGFTGKTILYGRQDQQKNSTKIKYAYSDMVQTEQGLSLTIREGDKSYKVTSPLLGLYQGENLTGCFAMAREIGLEARQIIDSTSRFQGMKRRMEKRLPGNKSIKGVTVIDDIAHSPEKAASVLETLREIYHGKIVAVFEPNIGGRRKEASTKYDQAFKSADLVVIPRLSKLKVSENENDPPFEGPELVEIIGRTHPNVKYLDEDRNLVEFLVSQTKNGDLIAFLGSHGFRGMIEETVGQLS